MIQFRIKSSSLEREKGKNIQQKIPLPLKTQPVRAAQSRCGILSHGGGALAGNTMNAMNAMNSEKTGAPQKSPFCENITHPYARSGSLHACRRQALHSFTSSLNQHSR